MIEERTSVGLDVHAHAIVGAAVDTGTGELFSKRLGPDSHGVVAWLRSLPGPVVVAYEAGPTGYTLARALADAGISCVVAAPSKIRRAPGDRVKTDRRDAELLARLLLAGDITAVTVPTVNQEAARDLVRAREDARVDLMKVRHRVSKLLLRYDQRYEGATWTRSHLRWLRQQKFNQPALQFAFDSNLEALLAGIDRRDVLDRAISSMAADCEYTPVTNRLACLRGISTLTAFALAVEIGDWSRFGGRTIASYLGLVPSEYSTGNSRSQGGITRTGNLHARRLLIQAAWNHKRPYWPSSPVMKARWDLVTREVRDRGHAGNRRLHQRWQVYRAKGKRNTVANTAVARELAGWCWSLAVMTG